jgi:hypothetical protein
MCSAVFTVLSGSSGHNGEHAPQRCPASPPGVVGGFGGAECGDRPEGPRGSWGYPWGRPQGARGWVIEACRAGVTWGNSIVGGMGSGHREGLEFVYQHGVGLIGC